MSKNKAFKTEIEAVFQPNTPNKLPLYEYKIADTTLEVGEVIRFCISVQGNITIEFGNLDRVTFTLQEMLNSAINIREQYKASDHDNK